MSVNQRREIWEQFLEIYYDTFYVEILAELLVVRWQFLDETTRILVALTTSGSAVSGWALWNQDNFKTIWAVLAGIAAVLSIVHTSLNVTERLKGWVDARSYFADLRLSLVILRDRMLFDSEFPIQDFYDELIINEERKMEFKPPGPRPKFKSLSEVTIEDMPEYIALNEEGRKRYLQIFKEQHILEQKLAQSENPSERLHLGRRLARLREELKEQLRDIDIIHFSGHGS